MSTVAGADTYPQTTTVPDPFDPATADSVDIPLEDTLNRSTFLLKRMAAHAEAQHPIEIESTNGTSVIISPIVAMWFVSNVRGVPIWSPF